MLINPMALGLLGAGNNPDMWAPILQAMFPQGPEATMPMLTAAMQPQPDIGAMLGGAQPPSPITPGMVDPMNPDMGMQPPVPPQAPASVTPMGPMTATPPPGQLPATMTPTTGPVGMNRNPTQPQVRAPEAPRPIMSGGVAGAQKANDLGGQQVAGSPAQLLMMALLGGRAGAQGQNPLRVPTLGSLF